MFLCRAGRPALGVVQQQQQQQQQQQVQQAALSSLSPAAREATCSWEVGEARAFREIPQPPR